MTPIQWMFHYQEIQKLLGDSIQVESLKTLADIDTSIQMFYMVVDRDNGKNMIEAISNARKKRDKDIKEMGTSTSKAPTPTNPNGEDELEDILTDEDKELLEFMNAQPATIKESRKDRNAGKFILPTRSKQQLLNEQVSIVNKKSDKKIKLGFREEE